MTQNEQKIIDAASALSSAASSLSQGLTEKNDQIAAQAAHIEELNQKIIDLGATPPTPPEDLSQEFTTLDDAVAQIQNIASGLTPAPAGTPATADTPGTGTSAPIDHGDNPVIGIGTGFGDPPQPGTGGTNVPDATPVEPAPADTPGTVGVPPVEDAPVDPVSGDTAPPDSTEATTPDSTGGGVTSESDDFE